MKWTVSVIAVLLGLLLAILFSRSIPETSITLYPPKQLHHVIYISVCGVLEGILITTDPVQYADWKNEMTDEMEQLEREALVAGRFSHFVAGLRVRCGESWPDNLEVIR